LDDNASPERFGVVRSGDDDATVAGPAHDELAANNDEAGKSEEHKTDDAEHGRTLHRIVSLAVRKRTCESSGFHDQFNESPV
jgi:hypothetical protein